MGELTDMLDRAGQPEPDPTQDPLSDEYTGPQTVTTIDPDPEPPIEPAAPAEPTEPEPGAVQAPPTTEPPTQYPAADPAAPPVEGETPPTEPPAEPKRWAGKYESPEALEAAYRNAEQKMLSDAQRANEAERNFAELQALAAQWLQAQDEAAKRQQPQPIGQPQQPQLQAIPEPTDEELAALGFESRGQYQALSSRMQAQMDARYAPAIQAVTEENQRILNEIQAERARTEALTKTDDAQAERAIRDAAWDEFSTQHPDYATQGTPKFEALATVITAWNKAWTERDQLPVDIGNITELEIAREAAERPVLAQILTHSPNLFASDEGVELARQQATVFEATQRASTTQPAPGTAPASPHVETGAPGATPTGGSSSEKDPMDEVIALDKQLRKRLQI